MIDGFINAIYVYDDRITFTYNYKDGTETITLSELESAKSSDIKCIGAPKTVGIKYSDRFLFTYQPLALLRIQNECYASIHTATNALSRLSPSGIPVTISPVS